MVLTLATPISEIKLAPGSAICLQGVTWEQYLALLPELGEDRVMRLTYSDGIVEIRMPGQLHQSINRVLAAIILTLAEVLDLDCNNLGSTTLNRPDLAKGIELDSCFYIQNATAGQGIVVPTSLSPDLAIEVDIASSSANKLAIYAAMQVPEVWLYQQDRLTIQALQTDGGYAVVDQSVAFPQVSAAQLNQWIEIRKTGTDLTVVKAVRQAHSTSSAERYTPGPSPQGERS